MMDTNIRHHHPPMHTHPPNQLTGYRGEPANYERNRQMEPKVVAQNYQMFMSNHQVANNLQQPHANMIMP